MSKWISILRLIGPPLLSALFPASPLTPIILAAVEAAEKVPAAGTEKKAMALNLIAQAIETVNKTTDDPLVSPARARDKASPAIDALVSTVNTWTNARIGG